MYEYHVMGAARIDGLQAEINKKAAEGWEPLLAYYDVKWFGWLGPLGRRHVVILRRPRPEA